MSTTTGHPIPTVSAQTAQMFLLSLGFCPRDSYDMLADEGMDPHPEAEPTQVSLWRLIHLIEEWGQRTGHIIHVEAIPTH